MRRTSRAAANTRPMQAGTSAAHTACHMQTPPAVRPLRVVIVDPDHRVRQSLAGLVCCLGRDVEVAGTTADAAEALRLVDVHRPQVVLLDPRLPDVDAGLAVISALRANHPETRIVVMGWSAALEYPAVANGATAFVGKGEPPNAFLEAIVRAADATA